MNQPNGKIKNVIINFGIVVAFCFLLNSFLNYEEYTLAAEGKWRSTKVEMIKGCGSAYVYIFTKTALSKNHLNLSIWNGYQELIYKKPLEFGSVSFRYYVGNDFFSFLIDKTDSLQYGIRFRGNKSDSSFAFIADKEGRFLKKYDFQISDLQYQWNRASIERQSDSFTLYINDTARLKFSFPVSLIVHTGLKGGGDNAMIDDFVVRNTKGEVVVAEDFSPPFHWRFIPVLFAVLLLWVLGNWFAKRKMVPSVLYFNLCILIGLLFAYAFYFFWLSARYPITSNCADLHGMKTNIEGEREVCGKIKVNYPVDSIAGKKKVILFLGSSQTWGSGATTEMQTMPYLVEKKVQRFFKDTNIIVINGGIAGFRAKGMYDFYTKEWYKYKPVLTVVNLSTNDDADTAVFKKSMEMILNYNKDNHIKTVLIQEPNYFVCELLLINHRTLEKLGKKFGVEVLPMQAYMDSLQDTGFLWWDYVHCTDYGYSLMAERICPVIIEALQKDSLQKNISGHD